MTQLDRPTSRAFAPNGPLIWGLTATQIMGWGNLYHCFPLYMQQMSAEFGWSMTDSNISLTIGLVVADLVSIPVGHWVDRRGGHLIMTSGAALGAVMLLFWSQVETLWGLYAIWACIGVAQGCSLGLAPASVVTANVRDYRRGLAYVSFFSALASTIAIPLVSLLISAVGWRHSLMVQAGVQLLGPFCINAVVLRGTRGSRSGESGKPASQREPSPVRRVLRMPDFWFLALACSVHWFIAMGLSMHILPLMQERGLSLQTAVTMMMINGPAAVAGRLMMFYLVPGSSGIITGRFMFPMFAAGTLLLALASDFTSFVAYAVTFGMAAGVLMIVRQTSVADIFGTRGYGAISGALAMVSIVPRTTGALSVAVMHDWFGSYDPVVWILFGLTVVGTAAFCLATAARRGD